MVTLQELHDELINDPSGLGYAPLVAAGSHLLLANELNLIRAGISIDRNDVTGDEVVTAIVLSEFTAVNDAKQREWLALQCRAGILPLNDLTLRAGFTNIFGAGTATRTRLQSLMSREGSRSEQLFGQGVRVSVDNIRDALLL